jgi:hypothetical protein
MADGAFAQPLSSHAPTPRRQQRQGHEVEQIGHDRTSMGAIAKTT